MNLPFFFLKSIQKLSNRIKGHMDHTHHYVFHHGLIKLIVCTILQKRSKSWDHFLFWSGFPNEKEDQVNKSLMNKQFGFAKRFKIELMNELVQDNVQENCSGQGFEEPIDEEVREMFDGSSEQVLKNDEKDQRVVSNHEEEKISFE